jgi:hypothetical protein
MSQAVYLLAWLMMLRIDEATSLTFESINKIPGERKCFPAASTFLLLSQSVQVPTMKFGLRRERRLRPVCCTHGPCMRTIRTPSSAQCGRSSG